MRGFKAHFLAPRVLDNGPSLLEIQLLCFRQIPIGWEEHRKSRQILRISGKSTELWKIKNLNGKTHYEIA